MSLGCHQGSTAAKPTGQTYSTLAVLVKIGIGAIENALPAAPLHGHDGLRNHVAPSSANRAKKSSSPNNSRCHRTVPSVRSEHQSSSTRPTLPGPPLASADRWAEPRMRQGCTGRPASAWALRTSGAKATDPCSSFQRKWASKLHILLIKDRELLAAGLSWGVRRRPRRR